MGTKKRVNKYPSAFQLMAMEPMKQCATSRHWPKNWAFIGQCSTTGGGAADSPIRELRKQVRDLKRVLAEKTLEVDFFKGVLQKIEARRQGSGGSGGAASTTTSGK